MAVMLVVKQMLTFIRGHLREEPRAICTRFKLCGAGVEFVVKQDSPLCGPCQLGVNIVKDYINQPDDELLKMLTKACENLPADLQSICKIAVTLVGKQMITYIRGHLRESAREICARFRLCGSSVVEQNIEKQGDTILCQPCQIGVSLVKDYLNLPDDEILKILTKACEELPENLQNPCKIALLLVGKQAIQYIRRNMNETPRNVCAAFRICARRNTTEIQQDSPLCGPCQLGVQLVKDYINKPDDELLGMLNKACENLPSDLQAPCKMAVMLVGKQMLTYVRGHLREEPRAICARFKLCGSGISKRK